MNIISPRFSYFFLFLACLLGYANSLLNDFMIDDHLVLFGQIGVENKSFPELFSNQQVSFYRPIGHLFLWICYRLFGGSLLYYHFTNLLLFIIIVILFYKIVELLTAEHLLSLVASLLFALHPVNSMFVNYITANIIATFVIAQQLSFVNFMKYLTSVKVVRRYYLLSILFFLFSLFSHEMAVVYPLFLMALMHFKFQLKLSIILRLCGPFVLLTGSYILFRMFYFPLIDPLKGTFMILPHFILYMSTVGELISWYLSKLMIPINIVYLWSLDAVDWIEWIPAIALVLFFMLAVYLLFVRWKKGIKPFALSIFIAGLLPVFIASFTYLPQGAAIIEPHWFYFSSIGFFILLAHYITRIRGNKIYRTAILLVVVGSYFFLLRENNTKWQSQETYCHYWISLNKNNATPYYWLGKSLLGKGDYRQAMEYFNKALMIPGFSNMLVLTDLAYAQYMNGQRNEGKQYLEYVTQFGPNYSILYYYLSRIYLDEHNDEKARETILTALKLFPYNKEYQKILLRIDNR